MVGSIKVEQDGRKDMCGAKMVKGCQEVSGMDDWEEMLIGLRRMTMCSALRRYGGKAKMERIIRMGAVQWKVGVGWGKNK